MARPSGVEGMPDLQRFVYEISISNGIQRIVSNPREAQLFRDRLEDINQRAKMSVYEDASLTSLSMPKALPDKAPDPRGQRLTRARTSLNRSRS